MKINLPKSKKQSGASAIEYAVIAAVVALAIFSAASSQDIAGAFSNFFETITNAISGSGSSGD